MISILKYLPIMTALLESLGSLYADAKAAIAEMKSTDPDAVKAQKVLADFEAALKTIVADL